VTGPELATAGVPSDGELSALAASAAVARDYETFSLAMRELDSRGVLTYGGQ
jgi:hypothetical protein